MVDQKPPSSQHPAQRPQQPPSGYTPPSRQAPLPQAPRHDPREDGSPNSATSQQHERGRTDRDPDSARRADSDRPQQKDIDEQRKAGAKSSRNWYRDEGSVIGEDPASIDFVGAYPWPNVAEPGENRDDDTPIRPPSYRDEELQETMAEEQRRKSDMDARGRRKFAERIEDDPLEKDYPSSPASAFRTQREKDAENEKRDKEQGHTMNRPVSQNRPQTPSAQAE